jgi:hypothetical protein
VTALVEISAAADLVCSGRAREAVVDLSQHDAGERAHQLDVLEATAQQRGLGVRRAPPAQHAYTIWKRPPAGR